MSKKKIVPKVRALVKTIPTKTTPVVKHIITPVVKQIVKPAAKTAVKPVVKSVPKPIVNNPKPTAPVFDKINVSVQKASAVKTDLKKKKMAEVNAENQDYFVYLKNPLEYRRHLLESSRKILLCLRSHQKIFLIRQKKLEETNKLKISLRELLYLNKKFNEKLPKYNTQFLEDTPGKEKGKPLQIKPIAQKKLAEVKHEKTEMDRLEESLANIERKLRTLQ